MPRGYRCIILAAFGWLILAGASEQQNQQGAKAGSDANSHQPIAAAPVIKPAQSAQDTKDTDQSCVDKNGREANCTAVTVQAAVDQARDADWQADAAILAVFIGLGTLVAAVWAAVWAKRAATHTETGAIAAKDGLEYAKKQGIDAAVSATQTLEYARQNAQAATRAATTSRAWICPADNVIGRLINAKVDGKLIQDGLVLMPTAKNYGQSPALKVKGSRDFRVIPYGSEIPEFGELTDVGFEFEATLAPGEPMTVHAPLNDAESAAFIKRTTQVVILVQLTYFDVFSNVDDDAERHITRFMWKATHTGGHIDQGHGPVPGIQWDPIARGGVQT